MPFIPEAVKLPSTIEVHNAELHEPIFYDPREDRLETYREFNNRQCGMNSIREACTGLLVTFITVTVIFLIITRLDDKDINNINNRLNITETLYDNFLIILY